MPAANHIEKLFRGNGAHFLSRMGIRDKIDGFTGYAETLVKACHCPDSITIAAFTGSDNRGSNLIIVANRTRAGLVGFFQKITDTPVKQILALRSEPNHVIVPYFRPQADDSIHISGVTLRALAIITFKNPADIPVPGPD